MHADILIIGSGFAAYQLVKTLRRMGNESVISVLTADKGDDYNKPDLSHAFSKRQTASDLVNLSASDFAKEYCVQLYTEYKVSKIDTQAKRVTANDLQFSYEKLVIATGASTFVPPISGDAKNHLFTFNSLGEFDRCAEQVSGADKVAVIGGGLIGSELAMDLASIGKDVTLIEPNEQLMANLLPEYIGLKLKKAISKLGVSAVTGKFVTELNHFDGKLKVTFSDNSDLQVDQAILCTGLMPNTKLAEQAGLNTDRGIVVDEFLQTSAADVYALGDCAQLFGEVKAFLQPIVLSATSLAKTLSGIPTQVTLTSMMVKVKTPNYPIQLAGTTTGDAIYHWSIDDDINGIVAKAFDQNEQLIGFVVTGAHTKQAFTLLREVG